MEDQPPTPPGDSVSVDPATLAFMRRTAGYLRLLSPSSHLAVQQAGESLDEDGEPSSVIPPQDNSQT